MTKMTMTPSIELITDQPPSCIEFCPADPSLFVVGTYYLVPDDRDAKQASDEDDGKRTRQSRAGAIELYRIERRRRRELSPRSSRGERSSGSSIDSAEQNPISSRRVQRVDKYELPRCSVLDLHFRPGGGDFGERVFAVCTSTAEMIIFRLEDGEVDDDGRRSRPRSMVCRIGSYQVPVGSTVLATSFAWNPVPAPGASGFDTRFSFAVTFSSGEVEMLALLQPRSTNGPTSGDRRDLKLIHRVRINPAHSLEAWTVALFRPQAETELYNHNGRSGLLLLSGGDDSVLTLNSVPNGQQGVGQDQDSTVSSGHQIFTDHKSHSAGVTAILPIFNDTASPPIPKTTVFLTGSYDEHIRLFTLQQDQRSATKYRHELVSDLHLDGGGGIWRLSKMAPTTITTTLILASCMHAGIHILLIDYNHPNHPNHTHSPWTIKVIGRFTSGHESMCYGADSVPARRLWSIQGAGLDRREGAEEEEEEEDDDDDKRARAGAGQVGSHTGPGPVNSGRAGRDRGSSDEEFVVASTSFYDRKVCVWGMGWRGFSPKPLGRWSDT